MAKTSLKATTVRFALTTALLLMMGTTLVGFYLAQDWLRDYASKIQVYETQNNGAAQPKTVASSKISQLTMTSENYLSTVTADINKYGGDLGISATINEASQPSGLDLMSPLASSVQPKYLTVTMSNPVKYSSLIMFIKAIETNLPKIQITNIKIDRIAGSNDTVTVSPITIEVYIK